MVHGAAWGILVLRGGASRGGITVGHGPSEMLSQSFVRHSENFPAVPV